MLSTGWQIFGKLFPCDIFETHLFEEDCFEQNECRQGLDTSDEASLISDIDGDDDYWTFIENPTYDTFENIFENLIYDVLAIMGRPGFTVFNQQHP